LHGRSRGCGLSDGRFVTTFLAERPDITVVASGNRHTATLAGCDREHDVVVLTLNTVTSITARVLENVPTANRTNGWVAALGNADGTERPLTRGIRSVVTGQGGAAARQDDCVARKRPIALT
jgi:S1-C subfamily serine protease